MLEIIEVVIVEALIAELAIKTFDVGVLRWFTALIHRVRPRIDAGWAGN